MLVTLVFGWNIYLKRARRNSPTLLIQLFGVLFIIFSFIVYCMRVLWRIPNFIRFLVFFMCSLQPSVTKPNKLISQNISKNQLRLYFIFPFLLGVFFLLFNIFSFFILSGWWLMVSVLLFVYVVTACFHNNKNNKNNEKFFMDLK